MGATVPEELSREEWEAREVYARFGLAVYFAQVLEAGVVNYLGLERGVRRKRGATFDVDSTLDRLFGNPLGQNLKELRDLLGDDWPVAEQLANALDVRNDIVHHYMRTRILNMGSAEGRAEMLQELETLRATMEEADAALGEHGRELRESVGITDEWVQREYERLTTESRKAPDQQSVEPSPGWNR